MLQQAEQKNDKIRSALQSDLAKRLLNKAVDRYG